MRDAQPQGISGDGMNRRQFSLSKRNRTVQFALYSLTVLSSFAAVATNAAQIISADTSSAITAAGGDFTVNTGVTVSTAVNTSAVTVSGVDVPNFTNNGSIMTPTNGGTAVNFNSTNAMSNIVNTGIMRSKSGIQLNSPAAIVNSGDMVGSDRTITLYAGATG